jgi:shikimate dehydrogenase
MGFSFLDTDELIEAREEKKVSQIFSEKGERYFREVEKSIIAGLPQGESVISTGGGAILDSTNVEHLRSGSTIFLLTADEDTIITRIQKSNRPPLTGLSPEEEIRHLLHLRRPFYLKAADYCLDTSNREITHTVEDILQIVKKGGAAIDDFSLLLEEVPALSPGDRQTFQERFSEPGLPLRICAVIGNPVSHSKSPALFNALFARYHLPYRYIRMESTRVEKLLDLARKRDLRGLSVTIPFKQDVLPLLDEVDITAQNIGAVNTVVQCGGVFYGYNTDWMGIRRPLDHLGGARAIVIGAGGAAAAAVYACLDLGMQVTILNRTKERGASLARRFGCEFGALSDFKYLKADVVINATPVGMHPDPTTPVPLEGLTSGMTVFDLVYTPPQTPFLRAAREKGCYTISGVEMFLHQAREQFLLFTGISTPEALIRGMMT